MKKTKGKEWHASSNKIGMGDYYGVGIRNPMGKSRDIQIEIPASPKKLGKPPKALA